MIGKTNLDQFATGLVGTRSPYGTPRNPFDPAVVPGGSSSGSGVAVAAGLVPFALGTDTAGSGRVPAALGNIVGCKPTLGLVSTDGRRPRLPLARLRVGVRPDRPRRGARARRDRPSRRCRHLLPSDRATVGSARSRRRTTSSSGFPTTSILERCDPEIAEMFDVQRKELAQLGVRLRQVDVGPFLAVGDLLYDGPWLAERDAAVGRVHRCPSGRRPPDHPRHHQRRHDASARPTCSGPSTGDASWRGRRRPSWVGRRCDRRAVGADDPDAGGRRGRPDRHQRPARDVLDVRQPARPLRRRGPRRTARRPGVPVGFTLVAPACSDWFLLDLADRYQRMVDRPLGATGARIGSSDGAASWSTGRASVPLAVVGAHLAGQPLNHQLVERGARLAARTTTAPRYRLVALADTTPAKPGLVRVDDRRARRSRSRCGTCRSTEFGSFVDGIPAPLAIGKLELADGSWVNGFVCEPVGDRARRPTSPAFGGWRAYLQSLLIRTRCTR